jgi:DNA repair exonuclease SbcCD nuclease subunit
MPKIYYGSDLHLEFHRCDFDIPTGDILILAGDIFTPNDVFGAKAAKYAHEFFKIVSEKFKFVYLILGNHEHYYGDIFETRVEAESMLSKYSNIVILDGESVIHEDIAIFGGTLWTNYDNKNPVAMMAAKSAMNDFNYIGFSESRWSTKGRKLTPDDVYKENQNYRKLIHNFISNNADKKMIVVTHHAPSYACKNSYRSDYLDSAYYNTGLNELFERDITWIHGHVHTRYEMKLGDGMVMSNPRGYPGEIAEPYELKELDLG